MHVDVVVVGDDLPARWLCDRLAAGGATVARVADRAEPAPWSGYAPIGLAELPHRTAASLGPARARALFDLFGTNARLLAHAVVRHGGVWIARDVNEAAELPAMRTALAENGVASAAWSPDEVAAWVGAPSPQPGVFLPDEITVDLDALGIDGGPAVTGPVTGEIMVLANGWRAADAAPWLADKLSPYREQAQRVTGGPAGPGRTGYGWVAWAPGPAGLTITGARWATPHLEAGEDRPEIVDIVQQRLDHVRRATLGEAEVVARTARIETSSCDGLPIVGPLPGAPRVVVAAGWHGQALSLGPALVEAVAATLLDQSGPRVPTMFDPSRFL